MFLRGCEFMLFCNNLYLFCRKMSKNSFKFLSYTAIGRHIYKRLKMCKQYAKEMATLQ